MWVFSICLAPKSCSFLHPFHPYISSNNPLSFMLSTPPPTPSPFYQQRKILTSKCHGPLTMNLITHGLLLCIASLLLPTFCLQRSPLSSPQGMLMEEKVRLGSTPPSCHNRCNMCNPCAAVQVPTLPGQGGAAAAVRPLVDQQFYSQYSNYKPLGWKCRCGDRLFNP